MSTLPDLRPDLAAIAGIIPDGSRVLDIGCGEGTLLAALAEHKGVDARGLEIDPERVATCVAHGLSVVQGDAEADLVHYPDDAFDYAILGQTIQMVDRPAEVIDELLRVGRAAFVSFPNFAHWRMRVALGLGHAGDARAARKLARNRQYPQPDRGRFQGTGGGSRRADRPRVVLRQGPRDRRIRRKPARRIRPVSG